VTTPPADVLVVVPAKNEADTIAGVVTGLAALGYPALVVDDGSTDATAMLAAGAGAIVVSMPFNLGVGGALRCGFQYAVDHGYRLVVQCDGDGQHRADQIELLLDCQQRTGAHLVIGDRFRGPEHYQVSRGRRAVMKLLSATVRLRTGLRVTDTTSGFRCIARPLLDEFAGSYPTQYLGDTFEAVVVAGRAGYQVAEVPVAMSYRGGGMPSAPSLAAATYAVRAVLVAVLGLDFRIRRCPDPAPTPQVEPSGDTGRPVPADEQAELHPGR
jgi:glycosyltransferase involved in cell wall biosynthesis